MAAREQHTDEFRKHTQPFTPALPGGLTLEPSAATPFGVPWESSAARLPRLEWPALREPFEVWAAFFILVLVAPLLGLVALAIKLERPGAPVFYAQERVGRDRRRRALNITGGRMERRQATGYGPGFRLLKFRTMVPDAEAKTGPVWAGNHDPRITRVGRVLRSTRMDELPQLVNVIRGEMSLIGPRPERPVFVREFCESISGYALRLSVSPGITGLAQVERNYDECVDDVRKKLSYDLYYIRNRSALMDIKILVKTVGVVVNRRGAR